MKGERGESEWKSQPGKWRIRRRPPLGRFGPGIREFYRGVQWPTRVSTLLGLSCFSVSWKKGIGVCVIFFLLWVLERTLVQVSILSAANVEGWEWPAAQPHPEAFFKISWAWQPHSQFTAAGEGSLAEGSWQQPGQWRWSSCGWELMLAAVSPDQISSCVFVITGLMDMAVVTNLNLIQYNFVCEKYTTWHSLATMYFRENIFPAGMCVLLWALWCFFIFFSF